MVSVQYIQYLTCLGRDTKHNFMKKYFGKNRKLVVSLFTRAFSLSHAPLYVSLPAYLSFAARCAPQSTNKGRGEIGGAYLPLSAYTTTLLVMVNRVKGGGRAPLQPHHAGLILPS
jgi:hypothetical protein